MGAYLLTNAKEILHRDIFNFLTFPHEGKRPFKKESVTIYVVVTTSSVLFMKYFSSW